MPFNDKVEDCRLSGKPLKEVQKINCEQAGIALVDSVPENEPYILFSDRTWFTVELLQKLVKSGIGRVRVTHQGWLEKTGPLQEFDGAGLYDIEYKEAGSPPEFSTETILAFELDLHPVDLASILPVVDHPRMKELESKPLWVGLEMIHHIDHWTHLLRINQLLIHYAAERGLQAIKKTNIFKKLLGLLILLIKARSFNRHKIMQKLNNIGKKVDIHPTAIVEFCTIEDGAQIGPFSILRGSHIGKDVQIKERVIIQGSSIGEKAYVSTLALINLSVVYPNSFISSGHGFQMSLVGRECFLAAGSAYLDLSFGKTIKVRNNDDTGWVDSELNFLGIAVGHRATIGYGIRLRYGVSVPNDAFLQAPSENLLRDWNNAPVHEPVTVINGKAVSLKKHLNSVIPEA